MTKAGYSLGALLAVGLLTLTMPAVASPARPGAFNVTDNATNDYTPSYSPSGKRIAYRGSNPNRRGNEIYTIGVGGGGRSQVTHDRRSDRDPSYAPADEEIAYSSWDGGDWEIFTIPAGG
jgi:Tol biopolymer transport system component